ncbi:hypothetical protein MMC26_002326 [Xylographa opegraphella]|nr:hypothetical protein [Xylographa opegraphella]
MSVSTVLSTAATVLYYIGLPVIIILRLLSAVLIFVAAPVLHVADYLIHGALWPMPDHLQTLYIYFGVAALVGICTAAVLHYSMTFLVRNLGIDRIAEERGRTLSSYRAEKTAREAEKLRQTLPKVGFKRIRLDSGVKEEYSDWRKPGKGFGIKGLLSTTILEEEDSSEAGF